LRETYYIALFNPAYNILLFGNSRWGQVASDATRRQMSIAQSNKSNPMFGIKLFGSDNPFWGKTHSDDSRLKMSIAKGTALSVYRDGELFGSYPSFNLAAKATGISRTTIVKYAESGIAYGSWLFVLNKKDDP
jgi:group I intron endonuclease